MHEIDLTDAIGRDLTTVIRALKSLHFRAESSLGSDGTVVDSHTLTLLIRIADNGPLRPSALADCLFVDLSTVSRQIAALEHTGWVRRERDEDDRRAQLLHLTEAGEAVLAFNRGLRREAFRRMLDDWTEDEREALAAQLSRLAASVQNYCNPAGTPAPQQEIA